MAEKIKIAELNINDKALLDSLKKTKDAIKELSEENKHLIKSGADTSQTFIQNEAKLKSLRGEYSTQIKVLQATSTSQDKHTESLKKEIKSVDDAVANNKELRAVRNQLDTSTKEGSKAIDEINKKMDKNNELIKGNASQLEKQKIGIGDYKQALIGTNPILQKMTTVLTGVRDAFIAKNASMKASAVATGGASKALRIFKLALISTGIGAIVVVLGSLISYLTTTQEGIDKVTAVTRPLQAIFKSLQGVVQTLGGNLFKALSEPKKLLTDLVDFIKNNVINRFKAFGVILEAIQERDWKKLRDGVLQGTTGVENLIDKVKDAAKGTADFLKDAAEKGAEIDRLTKSIEKSENDLIIARKKSSQLIKEQELIAKNTAKSTQERNQAAQKAIQISNDLADAEIAIIDKKIQRQEIENGLNDTKRKDDAIIAGLEADRFSAEEDRNSTKLKFIGSIAAAEKEAADAAKARITESIKQKETELDLLKEQNRFLANTDEERLELQRKYAEEELKILNDKLKNKELSEIKYATDKLRLENNLIAEENRIKEENEASELARTLTFEGKKRELENALALKKEVDENAKRALQIEQQLEAHLLELENLQLNAEQKLELEKLLKEQRDLELNQIDIANKEKNLQTEREIEAQRVAIKEQSYNSIVALAGAETNLGRALLLFKQISAVKEQAISLGLFQSKANLKLAEATVDIASGTAKSASAAPFPANIPLIAGFVATVAGLLSSIKGAQKKSGKFAQGGVLEGNSHANGGIRTPFGELEGGEAVINKSSTSMYKPLLSAINEAGGGKKFAQGGILGQASPSKEEFINYDKLAEAMSRIPNPIISVEEINSVNARATFIKEAGNF